MTKKKVILISRSCKYLVGALESFSIVANYILEQFDESDPAGFLKILKKNRPRLVFIQTSKVNHLLDSTEWEEIRTFMEKNDILFCGIGIFMDYQNNIQLKSIFAELFNLPLDLINIIHYIGKMISTCPDGQIIERRKGWDRRAPFKLIENERSVDASQNTLSKQEKKIHLTKVQINNENKTIIVNGKQFETSPKEFSILDFLLKNKGSVVKTEDILRTVWPEDSGATKSDVHQYIYLLRNKLEADPHQPKLLITVRGYGYKLGS